MPTPTPPINGATASAFFDLLYGEVELSAERALAIWSPKQGTTFCESTLEAVAACDRLNSAGHNAYFAVSLQNVAAARDEAERVALAKGMTAAAAKAKARTTRGVAAAATVVPGVWLDVDFAASGHAKTDLPPNLDAAYRLVKEMPVPCTLTIETGGGLHAYWVFHEPFEIHNEDDRAEIAAIVHGWNQLLRDIAAGKGWAVDSVWDLARVLRPAGTINQKYGTEVEAAKQLGPRCNPTDFDNYAEAPRARPAAEAMRTLSEAGPIDPNQSPPGDMLMAMMDLEPKFKATWSRQRTDLPSQSEYDLSLATMAAHSGWLDDDIVALLVAHRRAGKENLKTDRPDYYAATLIRAREGMKHEEIHESLTDRMTSVEAGRSTIEEERGGILEDLSSLVGLPVRKVIRYVGDPPSYRLVLDEGSILLPTVDSIINPSKFRSAVAACCGSLLGRFKGQRWDPIAQVILKCCEDHDLGADSSDLGIVGEWLEGYLRTTTPATDRLASVAGRTPFIENDGRVSIYLTTFSGWLSFFLNEKMNRKVLAVKLRSAGLEPKTVAYARDDGARSSVSVWVLPRGLSCGYGHEGAGTGGEEQDSPLPDHVPF